MIRLFLLNPATVFAARVNQASFTYPLAQVTFDGVTTGAYGDIQEGMTVLFGSTAGDDNYGRQRIRKAATSDTLYIGRSSQGTHDGEVDLADDAYITVLNDYRVWAKIPTITDDGDIYKDEDLAVVDRTTTPPPVANAGVGMAGTIAAGTSKLRVTLPHHANTSFAVSGTIASYAWTLPTGVTLVDGYALSDSQIQVDCAAGFYWVALTVTDSNGHTHTARVPIFARNPASDATISAFEIERHRITPEGQELTLRVLEDIDEDHYPDGTLVMLWEDEPSGPTDRSHMIFTGWLHGEPAEIRAERSGLLREVTLECRDVAGKLDALPGFPQSVESNASPSTWTEMATPNMDKYLHYLLQWHSTALEVSDWTWSGAGADYPFVILGSDGESLFDQVNRRAKALVPDHLLTCNRLGQMRVVVDPMLQATAARTATVQATLLEDDYSEITYARQRTPRVHWLRGSAIVAHATAITPIFCVAPGQAPGQGEVSQESGEQLAISQSGLNVCEGNRYARLNAPLSYFSITLAEGNDLGIEPADMTWVRLTIGEAAAQRGLTFTNARGLPRELDIAYDQRREGLVKTVRLTWERETSGDADAVTEDPPEEYVPPEFELPGLPPLPPMPPIPVRLPISKVYGATSVDGIYYTANFNEPVNQPTWVTVNGGLASTAIRSFCLDTSEGGTASRMFCIADGILYRRTIGDWVELMTSAEARTLASYTNGETLLSVCVDAVTGYVYALLGGSYATVAIGVLRSTDHGDNWTAVTVQAADWVYGVGGLDAHNGLVVFGSPIFHTGGSDVWYSTDHGATWPGHIYMPGFTGGVAGSCRINHLIADTFFVGIAGQLVKCLTDGTYSVLGVDYGFRGMGAIWFDPDDADHMATMQTDTDSRWKETVDGWANLAVNEATSVTHSYEVAEHSDDGYFVQGCSFVAGERAPLHVSTNGYTFNNRSGANWNSAPYADSIPETCGGIIGRGLWAVIEWG